MNSYKEIIKYFDDEIKFVLNSVDEAISDKITELRIRREKPIILVIKNSSYFVDYNGDVYDYPNHNSVIMTSERLDKLFLNLTDYSIYSSMSDMKNGYITLNNGARIGIASTCVYDNEKVLSVKEITSLNIRIPRSVNDCASRLLNSLYVNNFPSIIIAGPPNSGKTTLLRDLAYQLSNGFNDRYEKIAIVDERNEIAGKSNNAFSFNLGVNTDVLTGFSKAKGIEIATRTLSPKMIICDEISTPEELNSIKFGFSSGVAFALSVHIKDYESLINKPIIKQLLLTNEFEYIVLLNSSYEIKIVDAKEVINEISRNINISDVNNCDRENDCFGKTAKLPYLF